MHQICKCTPPKLLLEISLWLVIHHPSHSILHNDLCCRMKNTIGWKLWQMKMIWKKRTVWIISTYFKSLKPNVSSLPHDEHIKCGFIKPNCRQSCVVKSAFDILSIKNGNVWMNDSKMIFLKQRNNYLRL